MVNYSKQRDAILDVLQSTNTHPTAEWIYAEVEKRIPKISLGTVYRNLQVLEDLGFIHKVPRTADKDRYDANVKPHIHFICEKCGKIIDMDYPDDLSIVLHKFTLNQSAIEDTNRYALTLYGVCTDCKAV